VPTATIADQPAREPTPNTDDELLAALAALPEKQRWSVAYHYLAGLPYSEVAAILGGTSAAARRAAADGIATLRRSAAAHPANTPPHERSAT
jgi:DNA-directed RNA polymerase specialized sigma24 family protein